MHTILKLNFKLYIKVNRMSDNKLSDSVLIEKQGSYLSKRGYVLRKENLQDETLRELKKELKGRPLQDAKYNQFNQVVSIFPLYIETKNKIYIPKIYGLQKFGSPEKELDNYKGEQWENDIQFSGALRQSQNEPVDLLMNELTKNSSGGILCLGTGFGKTISCINILSRLKTKTLVIVNKISLLKQWENEINAFLPDARIGIIQGQKNVDVDDKDIVIAMLQSLAKVDYPDSLFHSFGCTVVDEVHNIASRVFSTVLMKVCSKYTIGLSATPKRSDGCEYVFKWFIGDIVYQSKSERKGLPPVVNTIKIVSNDYKEIATVNRITGQKQIQFTSMLSDLINMPKRNKLIVEMIIHLVKDEDRRVLVMSDRREHVKQLKHMLDEDKRVDFTYGLFLGQMKITDLEKSKASQVILATFQAFGEGVSEKDLDTLILTTPKKFIGHLKNLTKNESGKLEQIVGRIFRKEHKDKFPMILDLQDHFSVYKNQSRQRMAFYKEHFPNVVFREQNIDFDKVSLESIHVDKLSKIKEIVKHNDTDEAAVYQECLL